MDELEVMFADDSGDARGFRTVYAGPRTLTGTRSGPFPALGIGYGETKIIECFDFVNAIVKGEQTLAQFPRRISRSRNR